VDPFKFRVRSAATPRNRNGAAVRIAIETGLRQVELAGLTFERLHLDGPYPHVDLPRAKNDCRAA